MPAEEKIRIVMEGLRGEESVSELCRREGIATNLYHCWSKDFLEAGKKRLAGDTQREVATNEVAQLRKEMAQLKELVAETMLHNRVLQKTAAGFSQMRRVPTPISRLSESHEPEFCDKGLKADHRLQGMHGAEFACATSVGTSPQCIIRTSHPLSAPLTQGEATRGPRPSKEARYLT